VVECVGENDDSLGSRDIQHPIHTGEQDGAIQPEPIGIARGDRPVGFRNSHYLDILAGEIAAQKTTGVSVNETDHSDAKGFRGTSRCTHPTRQQQHYNQSSFHSRRPPLLSNIIHVRDLAEWTGE
jgi:hypothetical protein